MSPLDSTKFMALYMKAIFEDGSIRSIGKMDHYTKDEFIKAGDMLADNLEGFYEDYSISSNSSHSESSFSQDLNIKAINLSYKYNPKLYKPILFEKTYKTPINKISFINFPTQDIDLPNTMDL